MEGGQEDTQVHEVINNNEDNDDELEEEKIEYKDELSIERFLEMS